MPRSVDVAIASLGLVLGAPLWLLIALAVKLSSPGPVLFRQDRVGREGRIFQILKFRTMVFAPVHTGSQLTVGERDPRVTRLGSMLRRCKLDEIPQLFNVVRGDMSLVGPRPEVPQYVRMDDELHRAVLVARPGLTDPASIIFRNESAMLAGAADPDRLYRERILPAKLRLSRAYLNSRSSRSDVGIIATTLRKAVFRA